MARHEWSLAQLTAKAEAYCAATEHCPSEVRSKLQQWEATPEQTEEIIAHLLQHKYLDEERYCHAFAHDKLLYQGWGRIKIRIQLQSKRLPTHAIQKALEEIDDNEYQNILARVVASKKRTIKSYDPQGKAKLYRFCLQRGFTYEEIEEQLNTEYIN